VTDYQEKFYLFGKWKGQSREKIEQYRDRYIKMTGEFSNKKPSKHPYY
jgi:hypothetical protein